MFETVFTFTVFRVAVCRPLGSMNAWDDMIGRGSRTGADKMGKESGMHSTVGEISLSCELFLFSLAFLQVQLQLLPLNLHEA